MDYRLFFEEKRTSTDIPTMAIASLENLGDIVKTIKRGGTSYRARFLLRTRGRHLGPGRLRPKVLLTWLR